MKANRTQIEKALKAPGMTRLFLLHGPDESGSRALLRLLGQAVGADAERIDLSGAELKNDPARLADEAASIAMFGGGRWVVVEPAGDESAAAAESLLQAEIAGNPVALVAGALKPASRLLKLVLAAPDAMAYASYLPDARDADRIVHEMAREHGLVVRGDVARRIAEACGGNRAVIGQELVKLALYVDAAPEAPRPIDHDALDAVGTGAEEADLGRLVDGVVGGQPDALESELHRLRSGGVEGIPLVRAVLRRMMLLARLRGDVEAGNSVPTVMAGAGKTVFFKERDAVGAQLQRWRAPLIAKAVSRLVEAEHQAKVSGLGAVAVDEELFAISRQAARLR